MQNIFKKFSGIQRPSLPEIQVRETIAPDLNPQSVLNRTVELYHATFKEERQGLEYLIKHGIIEQAIYLDYKIGFVNGNLRRTLPSDGPMVELLKQIGTLTSKGSELFYNCVVFPIYDEDNNVVSLYGRHIEHKEDIYLSGPHKSVFNIGALKVARKIFLTESIIDSLSLIQMGIRETIPLYGVNGLTKDHVELFRKYQTREIYLCLGGNDQDVLTRIMEELSPLGIHCYQVALPDGIDDLNDYLLNGGTKDSFDQLVEQATLIETQQSKLSSGGKPVITEDEIQVSFDFKDRAYRIRGITAVRLDQLKVSIKLTFNGLYHIDTFDLYSAKARSLFTTQARKVLSIDPGAVNQDLSVIVEHLESLQAKMREEKEVKKDHQEMTEQEKNEAMEFLKSEDLLDKIIVDFKACGQIGEETNLLLGYLVTISRKLPSPLAVLVVSRSGSGKTTLQDTIISFTPPEDYEKYTRLTDQALFYKTEDALKHKLLAIEEEKGASGCAYSLRNLQSSHALSIAATVKDPTTGKLKTDVYKVSGPTAIMITTTFSEDSDFETYNRFIILTIDESISQTKRILERQRLNETIEGIVDKKRREKIKRRHHNAQRLLKMLEIANPYSNQLTFIDTILRARREQPKYLAIIKTIALLRQYQKEIKTIEADGHMIEYIEVDLKDIEMANQIANEILGRNLDELSPPSKNLLVEIKKMVEVLTVEQKKEHSDVIFTRRDVREFTRWSDYQIKVHIKQLEELEYLYSVHGGPGKRYAYQLLWEGKGMDGEKFLMGLIDITNIQTGGPETATGRVEVGV